jgi:hypothetical protein
MDCCNIYDFSQKKTIHSGAWSDKGIGTQEEAPEPASVKTAATGE